MNDPKLRNAVERMVIAGMNVMYSQQMRDTLMRGITRDAPIAEILASEVAGVMRAIDDKHQHSLPKQAMYPAAMMLMIDLAKFMTESGVADPSDEDMGQAAQNLLKILLAEYQSIDEQGSMNQEQQPMMMGA